MTTVNKSYSWKTAKCVRYRDNFEGENHPCYWCGVPPKDMFSPDVKWCDMCNGFICPSCGRCWCNVSTLDFHALVVLRNKYCCNWPNFKEGIQDEDRHLLVYVPGFQSALDYCRERKGFKE